MIVSLFDNIETKLISSLRNAEKEIRIAVCWFTNSNLFDIVCEKLNEKVHIELIITNDPINNRFGGLDFNRFISLGGNFYFANNNKLMHNKFCVIDSKLVITGSYNWTYPANKNHENILAIENEPLVINSYLTEFNKIKTNLSQLGEYKRENYTLSIDLLSKANYLKEDILYQSKDELAKGNINKAKILVTELRLMNSENKNQEEINAIEFEKETNSLLKEIITAETNKIHFNTGFLDGERVVIIFNDGQTKPGKIIYQRDKNRNYVNTNGETIYVRRDGFKGTVGIQKRDAWKLIHEE